MKKAVKIPELYIFIMIKKINKIALSEFDGIYCIRTCKKVSLAYERHFLFEGIGNLGWVFLSSISCIGYPMKEIEYRQKFIKRIKINRISKVRK